MKIIQAGLLIDGNGGAPQKHSTLIIEGSEILAIEKNNDFTIPDGAELIDASDYTVMPGMIDCHVHIAFDGEDSSSQPSSQNNITEMLPGTLAYIAYVNALKDLKAGFTSIRDMHCFDFVDISLRDAIKIGRMQGPRISAAGYGLTSTNGHMDYRKGLRPDVQLPGHFNNIVDDPQQARKAVRALIRMGVDHIKINVGRGHYPISGNLVIGPEMQKDVIQAICDEAHYAGRKVAAHSLGGLGELWAVQAGVDSLEHAHFITDETIQLMADKGTFQIPTMTHCVRNVNFLRKNGSPDERGVKFMEQAYTSMNEVLSKAVKWGVRIGVGTDAGAELVPHGSNASELEYLTTVGLSPMEAIVAATRTGANVIGLEETLGTLEKGRKADLLIIDGNPLENIKMLQNKTKLVHIIKDGNIV